MTSLAKDTIRPSRFRRFELSTYLPFRLTVLSNRLTRRVARLYGARFKLSAPEWRTVAVLGQGGAITAQSVIARTTMDKVRVSRAVAKLLKAGYITRDSDPQDRRRAILDLTDSGRAIYRQIVPLVQEVEAQVIGNLSPDEFASLDATLAKIEAQLDESDDDVLLDPEA